MPTVTVIIPAYNAAKFIQEAIASALNQSYGDMEIIVVDDGSTDDTPDILDGYGDHIRVLRQSNLGAAAGRNAAAQVASGEWLAFLDADDVWLPEKTEQQLRECGAHVVSHTNSWFFGEGLPKPVLKTATTPQYGGHVLESLLLTNFITTSTVMVRRDVFVQYGGFDSTYDSVEDLPLWIKICADHELGYVETPLAKYRLHAGAISRKVRKNLPMHRRLLDEAFAPGGPAHHLRHLRRLALAHSYGGNAHFAAASGDWRLCASCALRSLVYMPAASRPWKTLVKALLMPLGVKY